MKEFDKDVVANWLMISLHGGEIAISLYCLSLRPVRPTSLNLEQFVADNSSEVTGRTSGYSTSNDSDLEESREADFEDEDLPVTREEQV